MKRVGAAALFLLLLCCALPCWADEPGGIAIGVVYPAEAIDRDTLFIKGVELAHEQLSQRGGINGRPVELIIRDDGGDITEALQIAQTLVDADVSAVIGHWSSNVCQVVKQTYESNGTLMLTPAASGMELLLGKPSHIFRMIPNNDVYATALAQAIHARGLKNIAIYYSDDVYGNAFSNAVEYELQCLGVNVVDRISSISGANAQRIEDRWRAFSCDGVVVAAVMPEAAEAIRLIRDAQSRRPVFGAENFDRVSLVSSLGDNAEGIYMAAYDLEALDAEFLSAFRTAYGVDPDVFALTGYQSLMLLADALGACGGDAAQLPEYLAALEDYDSALGTLHFNADSHEFEGYTLAVRAAQ